MFEYDSAGRMVGSTTESEWDDEQRELVEAFYYVQARTGDQGEWLPEATSDGADPNNYDVPFRYIYKGPFTNWAEKTRLDAIDAYKNEAGDDANLNGLYWTVEKLEY